MTLGAVRRRPAVAAVAVLVFAAAYALAALAGDKPFYYDSGGYWALSDVFRKHGTFSLLNFDSPLRGYAFPLINHGLREIGAALNVTDSTMGRLWNAAVLAGISTLAAPRFAETCFPERPWRPARRVALAGVFLLFWSGYVAFPLSDFPALLMALVALVAVSRVGHPGAMLAAGAATGLAIEFRPSYVLLGPIVVLLLAWGAWRSRREHGVTGRRLAAGAALLVVGFACVVLPQSLATHRHFHSWSFVPGSPLNLSGLQLTLGMRLQRYDTFVGPGKRKPSMNYVDRGGTALLERQKGARITGPGQYLELSAQHPITMGGLFVRHLVNGLDVRYTTPYVERLDTGSHRPLRLAGFLVVFLALARLLWPRARRGLGPIRWPYLLALPATCLTSIPSAMETRFLLPIFTLSYLLVLTPGWPPPIGEGAGWRRYATPAALVVGFAVFMAIAWRIASAATGDLRFG